MSQKQDIIALGAITFVVYMVAFARPQSFFTPKNDQTITPTPIQEASTTDVFAVTDALDASGSYYTVAPGETVTLYWHIADGKEVYITQNTSDDIFGPLPPEGTLEVCPQPHTQYFLYTDNDPAGGSYVTYDLTLTTFIEIAIDTPIDLQTACWGAESDYFIPTTRKALMDDLVLIFWSVHDAETVTITETVGAEVINVYDSLPPSGMLAACERDAITYTLYADDDHSLQVTVSRANTAYYAAYNATGHCPLEGSRPLVVIPHD